MKLTMAASQKAWEEKVNFVTESGTSIVLVTSGAPRAPPIRASSVAVCFIVRVVVGVLFVGMAAV